MIVIMVIAAVIIGGSLLALRTANRLPQGPARAAGVRGQYRLITTLEYAGFAAALIVCNLLNQPNYLAPLIVLVSALHFLALGLVLHTRAAYIKGVLLSLIAGLTVVLLPAETRLSAPVAHHVLLWWVAAAFAGALVAWIDAGMALVRGLRIARVALGAARSAPPVGAG